MEKPSHARMHAIRDKIFNVMVPDSAAYLFGSLTLNQSIVLLVMAYKPNKTAMSWPSVVLRFLALGPVFCNDIFPPVQYGPRTAK